MDPDQQQQTLDAGVSVENENLDDFEMPSTTGFHRSKMQMSSSSMSIGQIIGQTILFLQMYGWYILILGLVLFYIWHKYLKSHFQAASVRASAAMSKKLDVNEFVEREAAVVAARERQQLRYAAELEKFQEEQTIKEEQKAKERIDDWERHKKGQGYKSKAHVDEKHSYNPLMGSGSGTSYRPPKKGCPGGSCGKP